MNTWIDDSDLPKLQSIQLDSNALDCDNRDDRKTIYSLPGLENSCHGSYTAKNPGFFLCHMAGFRHFANKCHGCEMSHFSVFSLIIYFSGHWI